MATHSLKYKINKEVMSNYKKINACRICKNMQMDVILDLGNQYLSGIFPKNLQLDMPKGPLTLVRCDENKGGCGHVQLLHTFDLSTMYGNDYGYRSGLNEGMKNHLKNKHNKIINAVNLQKNDIIVDIAGNDGTFLSFFLEDYRLLSIDPTASKFAKFYKKNIKFIDRFFSKNVYKEMYGEEKAKVITSFSMFYDLEDPCDFAKQVAEILDEKQGMWILEQSYMPLMLSTNSFDTVCHEHLSYYALRQIKYIMDSANLIIVDFEFNNVNGGSISLSVAHKTSKYHECVTEICAALEFETESGMNTLEPWFRFSENININKNKFTTLLGDFKKKGYKIAALGASTKGNITLQTWGITSDDIEVIGDVNLEKQGCYTPGSWIPIADEDFVLSKYDVLVILPWHFKEFFVKNIKFKNKTLIFPLPIPEVVKL